MAGRGGPDRVAARKARLERHAVETDPEAVLNAAARFLEARQRSVAEVRRHLATAGYPAALIESAVERLRELRILDDEAFARSWVESRDRAHPRGRWALERELQHKGIERATIESILDERSSEAEGAFDEAAEGREEESADAVAATRLLTRRAGALARIADPAVRRQRSYALLARNGFDPDVCREVSVRFVRSLSAGANIETDGDVDGAG